ncbi:universal stress protein [Streptomyces silvisoli]|uniref:Universal stress protein n=1 Tax=Streptomyces silvisoli TaxID=3034235 RepID=A0ABT5ZMB6_9ACTN|nr:universal stress protein [Streptomyces silvisoli]MDF3290968.1 universal stress protein [Streptomyces silvisoli]
MSRVVVAVDGSEAARLALEWAADEAERRGAPLKVVHADRWEPYAFGDDIDVVTGAGEAARELVAEEARRALARCPQLEVSTEAMGEETVTALLREGAAADLLVLGSRGRGGFEGMLLGSVSLRVVGRADFPVVVVRGDGIAPPRGRVVLGVGAHYPPGRAADFALDQAIRRKAVLDVVYAWQPDLDLSGLSVVMDSGTAQERAQVLLAAVTAPLEQDATGIRVRPCPVPGAPAPALLHAAADADLVVLGSRRRHGQLGPVTHAMLHHSPCPVAIVPVT